MGPDYFHVLRVPLLAGRMLSARDNQDAPLVIDSNIIIEGRLPALCATGFLSSSLVSANAKSENAAVAMSSLDCGRSAARSSSITRSSPVFLMSFTLVNARS